MSKRPYNLCDCVPCPVGPTGLVGPQGSSGVEGPRGPPGRIGRRGPIGEMGEEGNVGPIGLPGSQGPVGPTGPTGEANQAWGSGYIEWVTSGVPHIADQENIPVTSFFLPWNVYYDAPTRTFSFEYPGRYLVFYGASLASSSPKGNTTLYYNHPSTGPVGVPVPRSKLEINTDWSLTGLSVGVDIFNESDILSIVNTSGRQLSIYSGSQFSLGFYILIVRLGDVSI